MDDHEIQALSTQNLKDNCRPLKRGISSPLSQGRANPFQGSGKELRIFILCRAVTARGGKVELIAGKNDGRGQVNMGLCGEAAGTGVWLLFRMGFGVQRGSGAGAWLIPWWGVGGGVV